MAKFHGKVGFGAASVNKGGGVWEVDIVEKLFYGDHIRNGRRLDTDNSVNGTLTRSDRIEIMASPFAYANAELIRYVELRGVLWEVTTVSEERPRLVLQLGGKYNGRTPSPAV